MKWVTGNLAVCSRCLGAALLLVLVPVHEAWSRGTKLLQSSRNAITFEVVVPDPVIVPAGDGKVRLRLEGYGTVSPPGALEIPVKTFHVAVPLSGGVRVSATVQAEEHLGALQLVRVPAERFIKGENDVPSTEIYYPPDPWRSSDYPSLVTAERPSFMGRQRVLPVRVCPLSLGREGARLVKKLTVTVTIEGGALRTELESYREAPVSSRWKRLYDVLLVNPDDVSRYIKPLRIPGVLREPDQGVRRLRLHIPETGCYAVRADSLVASGLTAGLSQGEIALKKYYYDEGEPDLVREVDIPILVINGSASTEEVFSDDDLLVFYALGIKDDVDAGDLNAMFTDDNVVWLEEMVPGKFMTEGPPLSSTPGTPMRNTYRATSRNREDTYYFKNAGPAIEEYYYITGPAGASIAVPFDVFSPAGSDIVSLVVRLQGFTRNNTGSNLTFEIRNSQGGTSWIGNGFIAAKDTRTFTFDDISSDLLTDGENSLIIRSVAEYVFIVNDLVVDYPAQFGAHSNRLEFGLGPMLGTWKIRASGFSVNHGYVIEIIDPFDLVQYELTPGLFEQDGAEYTLDIDLEAMYERRFIILGDGAWDHLENRKIVVDDTPDNLRSKTGPYHTLIISHREFIDDLVEYENWRRGQGYRILKADVRNVYDEFNGGNPSCDAIKRFVRYGFDHWGVEFVLLVGDGSEDHKRIALPSPLDFIPPHTFGVRVSGEQYDDEVTSSDKYYSFLDDVQPDRYPDVFVGRFPVGEDIELLAITNKLYRFEDSVKVDDTWRRNIVILADDAWSGLYSDYRYRSYEREFEFSNDAIAGDVDESLPGGFDIRNLHLSRWTDAPHQNPNGDPGQVIYSRTVDSVHTYFTPYLVNRLNEGCLFFSFQGHANRAVLTTEAAFATFKMYDHLRYLYVRRPHVFIGVGCHISDFAHFYEGRRVGDGPNGDCFSEQVLFKPGVAAVGTYASNGYEYLHENAMLSETLHRYIFQSPPADSVPPQNAYTGAHWVLGEAITMAEIEHIANQPLYGYDQVRRYILLGDPMLTIDPGPPLMELEANWDGNWEAVSPDSFAARHGTNECILRLTASDVVALGEIEFEVNGDPWTDSLVITRLNDQDKTFARSYSADVGYTVNLFDEHLLFRVSNPQGREVGIMEIPIETTIRLFYNNYLEITPAVESPPTGMFKVVVDFPAYLDQVPVLLFDGLEQDDVLFMVDPDDSLRWETEFYRENLPGGGHVLTVQVGEFAQDFVFLVTGTDVVMDSFCFPNPFREGTNIVYTLNLPINSGMIDIYNVSGIRIRTITLPYDQLDAASYLDPHSIYWDGMDFAGDPVANGTYIYVIQVTKGGSEVTVKGKSVKLE